MGQSIDLSLAAPRPARPPVLARSLALMKPVTWFPPVWAFVCGSVAGGANFVDVPDLGKVALGIALAGPIVCGLSQVVNDYCDREVDAINEPWRLMPSGMVSTRQVIITVAILTVLAATISIALGPGVAIFTAIGLLCAVVYSAHPVRAKRNGWIGNALVAVSYEGLPWLAGAIAFGALTPASVALALLYSFGAHGIMTVNDFKSIDGDRKVGIRSLPARYGPRTAAILAVVTMDIAQIAVVGVLAAVGAWIPAAIVAAFLVAELPLQAIFVRNPREKDIFYNATGTMLFVWGMLAAALGVRL